MSSALRLVNGDASAAGDTSVGRGPLPDTHIVYQLAWGQALQQLTPPHTAEGSALQTMTQQNGRGRSAILILRLAIGITALLALGALLFVPSSKRRA
jgi:hypothetical protein